jgi:hypothetical protein
MPSPTPLPLLVSAVTVLDMVTQWTEEARTRDADGDEDAEASVAWRATYARMLAGILSGAVEQLCVAYNSVSLEP